MKRLKALILLALALLALAGCGNTKTSDTQPEQTTAATQGDGAKQLTGTISEIKDFMFVVTDETGNAYCFNFEEKPEGLDAVADGDQVTVSYTGKLDLIDAFTGEVLSVKKDG